MNEMVLNNPNRVFQLDMKEFFMSFTILMRIQHDLHPSYQNDKQRLTEGERK